MLTFDSLIIYTYNDSILYFTSFLNTINWLYLFYNTGLKTYFILGRKCDQESRTAELNSVWMEESVAAPISQPVGISLVKNSAGGGNSNNNKKANSLPSILDEMANSGSDSNSNLQETPLRTTRSVSQDRKKKFLYQQRSQNDELSPLSPGYILFLLKII